MTRKAGHSALRFEKGKLVTYDPHPEDPIEFPVMQSVEFSTAEDAEKAKKLCQKLDSVWRHHHSFLREVTLDSLMLARAVVKYFGNGPIDPKLDADIALRSMAKDLIKKATAK
jgi:hypothetical protein